MTTCNYCNCAINERDAAPDGRSVHADYFKCMAALRHRVAFLESELGAERSLFADIVSDLQTKVESLTAELGDIGKVCHSRSNHAT